MAGDYKRNPESRGQKCGGEMKGSQGDGADKQEVWGRLSEAPVYDL